MVVYRPEKSQHGHEKTPTRSGRQSTWRVVGFETPTEKKGERKNPTRCFGQVTAGTIASLAIPAHSKGVSAMAEANYGTNRWATILNANDDGKREITNISIMEGVQPEINVDARDRYTVEQVEDGVMIGMIAGGPVKPCGGWGFADELAAAGRSETGATRIADSKPDPAALPPVSHEKVRADAPASGDVSATAKAAEEKPVKKRGKSSARPSARKKKAR
jgi:hypothetical protein